MLVALFSRAYHSAGRAVKMRCQTRQTETSHFLSRWLVFDKAQNVTGPNGIRTSNYRYIILKRVFPLPFSLSQASSDPTRPKLRLLETSLTFHVTATKIKPTDLNSFRHHLFCSISRQRSIPRRKTHFLLQPRRNSPAHHTLYWTSRKRQQFPAAVILPSPQRRSP